MALTKVTGGTIADGTVIASDILDGTITDDKLASTGTMPAWNGSALTDVSITGIDDNATSTAITIDSSENVGIGVTPESWFGVYKALQLGRDGSIAGQTNDAGLLVSSNVFVNSSNVDTYISSDFASQHLQRNGVHSFLVASSGTADDPITWTTAMTIDNSGHTTLDGGKNLYFNSSSGSDRSFVAYSSPNLEVTNVHASGVMKFKTADTERMRINSSGNVGIGTSSPKGKLDVYDGSIDNSGQTGGRVSHIKTWQVKLVSSSTHTVATVDQAGHGASQLAAFYFKYTFRSMLGFNGGGGSHGEKMISGRRVSSTSWAIDAETVSCAGDSGDIPTLSCTDNGDGTVSIKITNPSSTHSMGKLELMAWDCSITSPM